MTAGRGIRKWWHAVSLPVMVGSSARGVGEAEPVPAGERLLAPDVLRGFAVLGILVVNIRSFSTPPYVGYLDSPFWAGSPDRACEWLIRTLAETKFYTLFAFLFGLGMAIQSAHVKLRGGRFGWIYARRLFVLLGFGLVHALFFWHGDVLTIYAALGLLLLVLRYLPNPVLLLLAATLHFGPLAIYVPQVLRTEELRRDPEYDVYITSWLAERDADLLARTQQAIAVYRQGRLGDMLRQRLRDHAFILADTLYYFVPQVLALFLLGMVVGRWRILHAPDGHRRLWRGLTWVALPLGLVAAAAAVGIEERVQRIASWWNLTAYAIRLVATPLLSFGYAGALILWLLRPGGQRRLAPLAAVGRMALTNYLLQTLVVTTLCYGYGLGWYGRLRPAWDVPLAAAVFGAQLGLSVWWLDRFRFGPLEWLWRSLTYWRWQPLRQPRPPRWPPPTQGLIT